MYFGSSGFGTIADSNKINALDVIDMVIDNGRHNAFGYAGLYFYVSKEHVDRLCLFLTSLKEKKRLLERVELYREAEIVEDICNDINEHKNKILSGKMITEKDKQILLEKLNKKRMKISETKINLRDQQEILRLNQIGMRRC